MGGLEGVVVGAESDDAGIRSGLGGAEEGAGLAGAAFVGGLAGFGFLLGVVEGFEDFVDGFLGGLCADLD